MELIVALFHWAISTNLNKLGRGFSPSRSYVFASLLRLPTTEGESPTPTRS